MSSRIAVALMVTLAAGLAGAGAASRAQSLAGACGSPPCYTTFTVNGGAPPPGVTLTLASLGDQIQVSLANGASIDLSGAVSTSDAVHMVLDVGSFDPVVFGSTGLVSSLSESIDGMHNMLTIDLTPSASSWNMGGCSVVSCGSDVNPVTATNDFGSVVLGFVGDMSTASQSVRDAMRGTWFSTNAQSMTLPSFDPNTGEASFTVAAPHFKTDGTTVNEGFFEFFAPDSLVSLMGIADPSSVGAGTFTVTSSNATSTTFDVSHESSPAGVLIQAGTNPPTLPPFTYSSPTFTVAKAPVAVRTLTVAKSGAGTGSVASTPAGITCGATCTHGFDDGTAVTLTATASAGSSFTGWSGGGCAGTDPCEVTLSADTTVTATFAKTPSLKRLSPRKGEPGTTVTVSGSNLDGASDVALNGQSVSFSIRSASQLTFVVPVGGTSGLVSVTTPAGTVTSSASFVVSIPPPSIASFSPGAGLVGSTVKIRGAHLYSATGVTFDGTPATTVTVLSANALSAVVPPGATTGKVAVTTSGGTRSSSRSFVVIVPPSISGFTPGSGKPGRAVTISGSGFARTIVVTFGGRAASFRVVDDGHIRAIVPHGASTGPIGITNAAGSATSDTAFAVT